MVLSNILQITMENPKPYGLFHLVSCFIALEITILLLLGTRKDTDKSFRVKIAIIWLVFLCFETCKQIIFNFDDNMQFSKYNSWVFPYQFCSTPFYVLPLIAFTRDCKFRNAIMAFASIFCFFGGAAVMVYVGDVLTSGYLLIFIQTMVHHGLQMAVGLYIAVYNRKKFSLRYYLGGMLVMTVAVALAVGVNELFYFLSDNGYVNGYVNAFFIGRKGECGLPILTTIQPLVPWWAFDLIYLVGFFFVGFIIYFFECLFMGINPFRTKAPKYTNNN